LAALIKRYNISNHKSYNYLPSDISSHIANIKDKAIEASSAKGFWNADKRAWSKRLLSWSDFELFVKFICNHVHRISDVVEYPDGSPIELAIVLYAQSIPPFEKTGREHVDHILKWAQSINSAQ